MKEKKSKVNFIRLEVNVEEGFGSYIYYVGHCAQCKEYNIHTSLGRVSSINDSCENGHYSYGYMNIDMFERDSKKIILVIKKLLNIFHI